MELLRGAYKTTSVQQQTSVPKQKTRAARGRALQGDACTDPQLYVLTCTNMGSASSKAVCNPDQVLLHSLPHLKRDPNSSH